MDRNNFIDVETGEMIDLQADEKDIAGLYKNYKENASKCNMPTKYKLVLKRKPSAMVTVKFNARYVTCYRDAWQDAVEKYPMDKYALAFISIFQVYLSFPGNFLVIDGCNPTVDTLASRMGIKKNKMNEILNQVERFGIIKRVKVGRSNIIYFNPYLFTTGIRIMRDTLALFKDSIFTPGNEERILPLVE